MKVLITAAHLSELGAAVVMGKPGHRPVLAIKPGTDEVHVASLYDGEQIVATPEDADTVVARHLWTSPATRHADAYAAALTTRACIRLNLPKPTPPPDPWARPGPDSDVDAVVGEIKDHGNDDTPFQIVVEGRDGEPLEWRIEPYPPGDMVRMVVRPGRKARP